MSRHHMLPPIVYTPAPPTPKKTERRRGVGYSEATGEADETEASGDVSHAAAPQRPATLPRNSLPGEATERRVHSTTGNLSDDTLKELLLVQEQDQEVAAGVGNPAPTTKD
jgi:hypothetical protein